MYMHKRFHIYGFKIIFPVLFLLSNSSCAALPFANAKLVGIGIVIFPVAIQSNNIALRFTRSSLLTR
jgi:hypothetical protein